MGLRFFKIVLYHFSFLCQVICDPGNLLKPNHPIFFSPPDRISSSDATRRRRPATWPSDPARWSSSGRTSGRSAWSGSSGGPANAVESNRKRNMSERISISHTWLGIGFCINCTVYSSFWPSSASCYKLIESEQHKYPPQSAIPNRK